MMTGSETATIGGVVLGVLLGMDLVKAGLAVVNQRYRNPNGRSDRQERTVQNNRRQDENAASTKSTAALSERVAILETHYPHIDESLREIRSNVALIFERLQNKP